MRKKSPNQSFRAMIENVNTVPLNIVQKTKHAKTAIIAGLIGFFLIGFGFLWMLIVHKLYSGDTASYYEIPGYLLLNWSLPPFGLVCIIFTFIALLKKESGRKRTIAVLMSVLYLGLFSYFFLWIPYELKNSPLLASCDRPYWECHKRTFVEGGVYNPPECLEPYRKCLLDIYNHPDLPGKDRRKIKNIFQSFRSYGWTLEQ